jgi:hypothetical protein
MESRANGSPHQIPVNREIYREFHHLGGENKRPNRPIRLNEGWLQPKIAMDLGKQNRELSEA